MKPGEELVQQGIQDLKAGQETIPALVVSIGAPRLQTLGFTIPLPLLPSPEHRLYEKLQAVNSNAAHSQYNALIRRLVSFERAAACAR